CSGVARRTPRKVRRARPSSPEGCRAVISMHVLFWFCAAVVTYVYFGYPAVLAVWARIVDRRPRRAPFAPGAWPAISIVVAVRNEAPRLAARIENLIDQQYPGAAELIVVSDGSPADPASPLAPFGSAVRLIELPVGGKPLALNAGVEAATGDVVVFADARQRFAPGAIVALVENFADPRVGGATGELVLDCEERDTGTDVGEGIGLYWKYEKWLRRHESRGGSPLGAPR